MNKAELTERFEKIYKQSQYDELRDITMIFSPTNLLRDLANFFDVSQLEEFYEFILEEKGLTERDIKYMD